MKRLLAAIFFFFLAFVLMHWPALSAMTTDYWGGNRSDAGIYTWLLVHNAKYVLTYPSIWFDADFFYPFGLALAFSDNFLLPSAIAKALFAVGADMPLAYNLLVLAADLLNGLLAFGFVYYVTKDRRTSLWAGAVFMFLPFLKLHLGHPQLHFAFFIPAALWATLVFCQTRSWRSGAAIGLLILGAFLTTVYYALFIVLAVSLFGLSYVFLRWRTICLRDIGVLAASNLPSAAILSVFLAPYLEVRDTFGGRGLVELKMFSTSLLAYLSAPANNLVWGKLTHSWANPEAQWFFGISTLVLVVIGVVLFLRATYECNWRPHWLKWVILSAIPLCFVGGVVGLAAVEAIAFEMRTAVMVLGTAGWLILGGALLLLFASGCGEKEISSETELSKKELGALLIFGMVFFAFLSIGLIGHPSKTALHPGLAYLVLKYLPGFNAIRAFSRVGIVAVLCALVLGSFGFSNLLGRFRPRLAWLVYVLVFGLSLVELYCPGFPLLPQEPTPGVYKTLAALPEKGAAIGLPFGTLEEGLHDFVYRQTAYMEWFSGSGRRFVNGYSGKMANFHVRRIGRRTKSFPERKSLKILSQIVGLRYIVYNPRFRAGFNKGDFEKKLSEVSDQLELLDMDETGNYLFRFRPRLLVAKREQLFVPPSAEASRKLRFTVKQEQTGIISAATLRVLLGNRKQPNGDYLPVVFKTKLLPFKTVSHELELPPSSRSVISHKVNVSVGGLPKEGAVVIEDIELD